MANLEKTVSIIFSGEDKLTPVFQTIESGMGKLEGAVSDIGDISAPFAAVTDKVLALDAALIAMTTTGLYQSVKVAGELQLQFSEISTVMGTSSDRIGEFSDSIRAYASTSTQKIEDINKSVYTAMSVGLDYKDALSLINQAEMLSVAGRADLNATTDVLTSTMNAYGASADEAGKYSDYLFQAVLVGKTTVPELASSLAQVTGIAASANVPFDDLSAAIAALTAYGLPTSQAITGIKSAIENIVKPTQDAQKAADSMGIQFDANALKSKGLEGVLKEVITATGGNVAEIGRLFTTMDSLNTVLTLGSDRSGKFQDALKSMEDAAGSTAANYKKMVENIDYYNNHLSNNVKLALDSVGKHFLDSYGEITGSFSDIFKAIATSVNSGSVDELINALQDAFHGMSEYLDGVADALPEAMENVDWSGFVKSLKDLSGAVSDIFGDLDLTDSKKLGDAIQFVVDTGESLIKTTEGIVKAFDPFIDAAIDAVKEYNKLNDSTKLTTGETLGFGKVISTLIEPMGSVLTAVNTLGGGLIAMAGVNGITGIVMPAFSALGVSAPALSTALSGIGAAITPVATTMASFGVGWGIGSFIRELYPEVDTATQSFYKWIDSLVNFSGASGNVDIGGNKIIEKVDEVIEKVDEVDSRSQKTITIDADTSKFESKIKTVTDQLNDTKKESDINYTLKADTEHLKQSLKDAGILIDKTSGKINEFPKEFYTRLISKIEMGEFEDVRLMLDGLPTEKKIELLGYVTGHDNIKQITEVLKDVPEKTVTTVLANVGDSKDKLVDIHKELRELPDGKMVEVTVQQARPNEATTLAKELAGLPTEKLIEIILNSKKGSEYEKLKDFAEAGLEIKLKGDIDTKLQLIESKAETIQTKMEWDAKVSIEGLDGVESSIKSSSDLVSTLFGNIPDENVNPKVFKEWMETLEKAKRNQEDSYDLQKKLLEQQVLLSAEKVKRLQSGEPLISV